MSFILAVDSGNTFIKWGLYTDNLCIKSGRIRYEEILILDEEFSHLPKPDIVIVSHVARAATKKQLIKLISIWNVRHYWVVAQEFQCNVSNSYSIPQQLGSDRWASLIAAWNISQQACLVISVGTAMTIDALTDTESFLGGIIMPGIELMHKSLSSHTQLVNINHSSGNYKDFPQNTIDAIESGVIQCMIGAIDRMYNLLALQVDHPVEVCILTGGGASKLIPYVKTPVRTIENLVLEGLVIIANNLHQ